MAMKPRTVVLIAGCYLFCGAAGAEVTCTEGSTKSVVKNSTSLVDCTGENCNGPKTIPMVTGEQHVQRIRCLKFDPKVAPDWAVVCLISRRRTDSCGSAPGIECDDPILCDKIVKLPPKIITPGWGPWEKQLDGCDAWKLKSQTAKAAQGTSSPDATYIASTEAKLGMAQGSIADAQEAKLLLAGEAEIATQVAIFKQGQQRGYEPQLYLNLANRKDLTEQQRQSVLDAVGMVARPTAAAPAPAKKCTPKPTPTPSTSTTTTTLPVK